jgi:hypothetical protein
MAQLWCQSVISDEVLSIKLRAFRKIFDFGHKNISFPLIFGLTQRGIDIYNRHNLHITQNRDMI